MLCLGNQLICYKNRNETEEENENKCQEKPIIRRGNLSLFSREFIGFCNTLPKSKAKTKGAITAKSFEKRK